MHLFFVRTQISAYQLVQNNAMIGGGSFQNVVQTQLTTIGFFPTPQGDFFTKAKHQEYFLKILLCQKQMTQ